MMEEAKVANLVTNKDSADVTNETPDVKEAMVLAAKAGELINKGRRNLAGDEFPQAVEQLAEACKLLADQHGEQADQLAEPYFYYGKALLELARVENGVLGNALDGVANEEEIEADLSESEQFEKASHVKEEERDELREKIYDAMSAETHPECTANSQTGEELQSSKESESIEESKSTQESEDKLISMEESESALASYPALIEALESAPASISASMESKSAPVLIPASMESESAPASIPASMESDFATASYPALIEALESAPMLISAKEFKVSEVSLSNEELKSNEESKPAEKSNLEVKSTPTKSSKSPDESNVMESAPTETEELKSAEKSKSAESESTECVRNSKSMEEDDADPREKN